MATYFPSSNNQRDIAPMLYSETQILSGNGIMYMNYPSTSVSYSDTVAVNSQQQNSCIDNLPVGAVDSNASQQEFLSNLGGSRIGDQVFNAYVDGRNEMHPMGGPTSILQNGQNLQGQGLSLSLSPQIPSGIQIPSVQYQNPILGFSSFSSPNSTISRTGCSRDDENSQNKESRNTEYMQPGFQGSNLDPMKDDVSQYGIPSIARTIPNSKYLNAAQQLLEEVVNIRKALKQHDSKKEFMKDSKEVETSVPPATGASSNPQESTSNSASELSAVEKQDLQNKMTKLFSMLDEVERRFKQYYHQMQIVVSLFDVIAGCGAAKPYTALALQTISRHFRCLRDAINGQIQVTQRSLGEQDGSTNSKGIGISRLRYVDQQLRQQRALQQLGMMQQHTWRPQRGLPETSVSILRAWLFEHFLHPYPKDSEKIMLARQTGLTRSQVSNWFINARVRLWKPMVEDMYKEEAESNAEMDSLSSSEITPKATKCDMKAASEDRGEDVQQSATERCNTGQLIESKSDHPRDVEMMGPSTDSSFHNVTRTETETRKLMGDQRPSVDDFSLFGEAIVQSNAYHLARFGNGSGVSLTLGLQHCEDGTRHNFVTMRGDDVYNAESSSAGPESADFDCMDSGSRQHMFGSSHLLHDFKA